MINTIVLVVLYLVYAGIGITVGRTNYRMVQESFTNWFMLPPTLWEMVKRPWTIVSHMFLHVRFFHFLFNMLVLFMFGRVFGDLMGDRRVVPLYILGGLMGIVFIQLAFVFGVPVGYSLGASAAIMAIVVATALIAPNNYIHLMFLGPIKIKWIALFFIFMDVVGLANLDNTGGHFGHIGGMVMGWLYILMIQSDNDPADWMHKWYDAVVNVFRPKPKKQKKSPLSVKYKATVPRSSTSKKKATMNVNPQDRLDAILDKISKKGIKSLSKDEKEFLDKASKND